MESNKKHANKERLSGRRRYDDDFKKSVLDMLLTGQSVSSVSQSLGIGESLLYKWKSESTVSSSIYPPDVGDETSVLRKQVKQLELERDILKKALVIFSRAT